MVFSVEEQYLLLLQIFQARFQLNNRQRRKWFKGARFLLNCSMKEWPVISLILKIFPKFWSRFQFTSKKRRKCLKVLVVCYIQ